MRVILHADDLGMSEAVNRAACDLLARGLLTSASVLANGPAFDDAARRLRGAPSVGVHLNLTEHRPLTPASGLQPYLREGAFSAETRLVGQRAIPSVVAEWSAQVGRAIDAGLRPDHLDSHQHIHHRPLLLRALLAVARRFGIRAVRGMAGARPEADPLRDRLQGARAAAFRARIRLGGATTTDGFGSASLLRALAAAGRLRGRSFEIMLHPGNSAHAAYAEEIAWLEGGGLDALPIQVVPVSWRQLR